MEEPPISFGFIYKQRGTVSSPPAFWILWKSLRVALWIRWSEQQVITWKEVNSEAIAADRTLYHHHNIKQPANPSFIRILQVKDTGCIGFLVTRQREAQHNR